MLMNKYVNDMSTKPVLIIGGGGHAKVIIDTLKIVGRNILGIVDTEVEPGEQILGVSVLGNDETVYNYDANKVELANGIGALPGQTLRWRLGDKFRKDGYKFTTVVHPGAIIGSNVMISEGVQIMAGCVVQPYVEIGMDTIINTGTTIDHDCHIGACCHIAPGVTLSGGVKVGENVHIGTGTNVVQQIIISDGVAVYAGTLVSSDIRSE